MGYSVIDTNKDTEERRNGQEKIPPRGQRGRGLIGCTMRSPHRLMSRIPPDSGGPDVKSKEAPRLTEDSYCSGIVGIWAVHTAWGLHC